MAGQLGLTPCLPTGAAHRPAACRSERKLRAVKLNKEDVTFIEKEFDVKTDMAERFLREQGGDLQATIRHLIGARS
jgi:NACalpha-BTF3-like transcription factor